MPGSGFGSSRYKKQGREEGKKSQITLRNLEKALIFFFFPLFNKQINGK